MLPLSLWSGQREEVRGREGGGKFDRGDSLTPQVDSL